nr:MULTISPECIES: SWIM zinc finger family protein [unclassified Sulfolobus]
MFFIYIGRNNDYVLNLNYCSCPFYLFNVLLRNEYDFCYHTLGLKYALEKDQITKIELYTKDFKEILTEIYSCGKSLKLRRILNRVES